MLYIHTSASSSQYVRKKDWTAINQDLSSNFVSLRISLAEPFNPSFPYTHILQTHSIITCFSTRFSIFCKYTYTDLGLAACTSLLESLIFKTKKPSVHQYVFLFFFCSVKQYIVISSSTIIINIRTCVSPSWRNVSLVCWIRWLHCKKRRPKLYISTGEGCMVNHQDRGKCHCLHITKLPIWNIDILFGYLFLLQLGILHPAFWCRTCFIHPQSKPDPQWKRTFHWQDLSRDTGFTL